MPFAFCAFPLLSNSWPKWKCVTTWWRNVPFHLVVLHLPFWTNPFIPPVHMLFIPLLAPKNEYRLWHSFPACKSCVSWTSTRCRFMLMPQRCIVNAAVWGSVCGCPPCFSPAGKLAVALSYQRMVVFRPGRGCWWACLCVWASEVRVLCIVTDKCIFFVLYFVKIILF